MKPNTSNNDDMILFCFNSDNCDCVNRAKKRGFKQGYAKCRADVEKMIDNLNILGMLNQRCDAEYKLKEKIRQEIARLHSQQDNSSSKSKVTSLVEAFPASDNKFPPADTNAKRENK